jgi:hypothetical protein
MVKLIASNPLLGSFLRKSVISVHPCGAGNQLFSERVEIYEAPAIKAYSIVVAMIYFPLNKVSHGQFC